MIRLYIDVFVDERINDIINWVTGWLYRHGYAFKVEEHDYSGDLSVEIYTKGLEPVSDIFEFVVGGFGDAFRYFVDRLKAEIEAMAVCGNGECVDIWFEDLKRLEEQEFEEFEKRWEEIMNAMWDEINYDTCIRAGGL
jgi:hypothetical protein